MELHCSKTTPFSTVESVSFVPIWNYIALKLYESELYTDGSFVPIWNYIALKQEQLLKRLCAMFCTHMELHCSKTESCHSFQITTVLYPYGITLL